MAFIGCLVFMSAGAFKKNTPSKVTAEDPVLQDLVLCVLGEHGTKPVAGNHTSFNVFQPSTA